jgi:hypothetical protein
VKGHKVQWTEQADRIIRDGYIKKERNRLGRVASMLRIPKSTIQKRAVTLGLTTPGGNRLAWVEEEVAILELNAHFSIETITRKLQAKGFSRSASSVRNKLFKLNLNKRDEMFAQGIYTTKSLALCIGHSPQTILRWIKNGLLDATPAGTDRVGGQHGDYWLIKNKAVRKLLIEHTAYVDFTKIEKYWLVDVLTGK